MRRHKNVTLSPQPRKKLTEVKYKFEERDEDEYYYYSYVRPSPAGDEHCADYDEELASETATINFCIDDRDESITGAVTNSPRANKYEKKSTRFQIAELIPSTFNSAIDNHKHRQWYSSAFHSKHPHKSGSTADEIYYEYLDEEEIHEIAAKPIDRLQRNDYGHSSTQERRRIMNSQQPDPAMPHRVHYDVPAGFQPRNGRRENDAIIDYSSCSFRDAKAAINAAAQKSAISTAPYVSPSILKTGNRNPERECSNLRFADDVNGDGEPTTSPNAESARGVRVRHVGDTTIVTHHRDPYSFYWQLDKVRPRETSLPRRRNVPQAITVDEVSEEDEEVDEEPLPAEKTVLSPDSNDSGVNVNMESDYAKPFRDPLPAGWEKHKDPSGYSYYWHVDSGVIQREPPSQPREQSSRAPTVEPCITSPSADVPPPLVMEEHSYRQTTTKRRVENSRSSDAKQSVEQKSAGDRESFHMRFIVRSLGGVELTEEELRDVDASSRAVNSAISRLSHNADDRTSGPISGQWNDGALILLDLDEEDRLTLRDAQTEDILMTMHVQNIRVWGVGKENPRDFAIVTRSPQMHNFFCHVFRCEDTSALEIANALRGICSRIIHSRHQSRNHYDVQRPTSLKIGSDSGGRLKRVNRESLLLMPVDEPKRIIRCQFIGITQVPKATGIETLNEAVDRLVREVGTDRWLLADVSVAPSTILIHEATHTAPLSGTLTRARPPVAECRVRFLSFLGIGRDIKHCAFIMHNANADAFLCYVFRVEPNAALMAKTVEAACKLRYQKVLDAHLGRADTTPSTTTMPITTTTTYVN